MSDKTFSQSTSITITDMIKNQQVPSFPHDRLVASYQARYMREMTKTDNKILGATITKGIYPTGYTSRGVTVIFNHGRIIKVPGKIPSKYPCKDIMRATRHLRRLSL